MSQGYVKLTGTPRPFAYNHAGTTFASINAATDLKLVWDDATTETMVQGTRPVLQSDGMTGYFDSFNKTYMVVLRKGKPNQPQLVEEKNYTNLATYYPSDTWAVVYRATQTLELWQQS